MKITDAIKRYKVVIKGTSSIRQHKRPEVDTPKFGGRLPTKEEEKALFEAHRYYDKKIGYYQPSTQVKKALVLAAHREKVPGEGNTRFSKYVSSAVLVGPDKLVHKNQNKKNVKCIGHWTVNESRGQKNQVWCVKPEISDWELEFTIDNLMPEKITDEYLKYFLKYAGIYNGIGADRPERGKVYGRFEIKSFKRLDK